MKPAARPIQLGYRNPVKPSKRLLRALTRYQAVVSIARCYSQNLMPILRDTTLPNNSGSRSGVPRASTFLIVLLFFFVSGGSGLLYQVVWTRRLVLLFGATSYAVSTVLAIFFLGLAIGSWLGGRLADRS